jgi:hypothetical protein
MRRRGNLPGTCNLEPETVLFSAEAGTWQPATGTSFFPTLIVQFTFCNAQAAAYIITAFTAFGWQGPACCFFIPEYKHQ